MDRYELDQWIALTYGAAGEQLFMKYPSFAVYRHAGNRKWFAVIMEISKEKLGIAEAGELNVVNLKCDPLLIGGLLQEKGIYKGYHMNKNHWITVCLDGSVGKEQLKALLDLSFELTDKRKKER